MIAHHRRRTGLLLRDARKRLGMKQANVAIKLAERGFRYSEQAIAAWESGRAGLPLGTINGDKAFLDVLGSILKLSPEQILMELGILHVSGTPFDEETLEMAQQYQNSSDEMRQIVKQLLYFERRAF